MGVKVRKKIDKGEVKSIDEAVRYVRERNKEDATVNSVIER